MLKSGLTLDDLRRPSPVHPDDCRTNIEHVIDYLFPGGDQTLVCCGLNKGQFNTRPLGEWRRWLALQQYVVPNIMSARTGLTMEGKESEHCVANTGARRYLIIEFDQGSIDDHACLHMHLSKTAKLALVVFSGRNPCMDGTRLLGCRMISNSNSCPRAIRLGADKVMWTRSQFTRMPEGTHANGRRQRIQYFNPSILE